MSVEKELSGRFKLDYDLKNSRRLICEKEVIIHCHHYNARIQHTIEGAQNVDGKKIIRDAAESVFCEQITSAFRTEDTESDKWAVVQGLYGNLGYGALDFTEIEKGVVTASSSHFVEGWQSGFKEHSKPVCTFTEGYLQGAIYAVTGQLANVRETECMNMGADRCRFEVSHDRTEAMSHSDKTSFDFTVADDEDFLSSNIDENKIIAALAEMPIHGDESGLIPAFNVYLANTPADFYNRVCISFIDAMKEQNLFSTAKKLLYYAGETCGMNTFRGIMESAEWEGLIAPMVQNTEDKLFGLVAVSNALGWGNWRVSDLDPGETMSIKSLNGYEAYGYREYKGTAKNPQCFMLLGVATGLMELIYSEGTVEERFGTFSGEEEGCISCEDDACTFVVEII